jgi:hypothetical protein
MLFGAPIAFEVRAEGGATRLSGRFPYGAETSLGDGRRERFAAGAFRSRVAAGENIFWKEAQPEWTQDGHVPIDRLLCRQCSRRLPEHGSSHMIFCSSQCRTAWHSAIYRRARRAEITAAREAGHAA